jgi:hypothetical protein
MADVRDHLVAMMESLNDKDVSADTVNRARAMADVAQAFTNTVKVEIDARRMAGLDNALPDVLDQPPVRSLPGRRVA